MKKLVVWTAVVEKPVAPKKAAMSNGSNGLSIIERDRFLLELQRSTNETYGAESHHVSEIPMIGEGI